MDLNPYIYCMDLFQISNCMDPYNYCILKKRMNSAEQWGDLFVRGSIHTNSPHINHN